mmetsp:Transcript_60818/g.120459  ORF Transcript_60818/g.120459 Transcript_60818/m.120459 type:complete len:90 (-) Transcript_60818:2869-3138(-)
MPLGLQFLSEASPDLQVSSHLQGMRLPGTAVMKATELVVQQTPCAKAATAFSSPSLKGWASEAPVPAERLAVAMLAFVFRALDKLFGAL